MNSVIETILGRRSHRSGFGSRPVPDHVLEQVVRCGLAAPSSKDARPWRFHVIPDQAVLKVIADIVEKSEGIEDYVPHDPTTGRPRPEYRSTVLESAAVLRAAPAGIIIESRGVFSGGRETLLSARPAALAGAIVGYGLELVGVGAAIQNLWLAAESLGLGGVFMGDMLVAETKIQERLGIRGDLVGIFVLGYPAGAVTRTPLETRTVEENLRWVREPPEFVGGSSP